MKGLEGKPYITGANGPDSFDCSGAACWGIRIAANQHFGDYSADYLYNNFTIASKDDEVGTLIFYDYTGDGRIDHVTSIINIEQMVHPSSSAKVIEIRPINYLDSYTAKKSGTVFRRAWNWELIKKDQNI